jgi:nucleoside-diphosphate-sugar epimerase
MTTLIIGAGLVGSQIARLLVEAAERPILMDLSFQRDALAEIVDLDRCVLVEGDVMRPLTLSAAIIAHGVTDIIHLVAYPMLTLGAQRDPYAAIQLNIIGTVNVLEAARIHKIRRVVVASSSVLNSYMAGGEPEGDLAGEEAYPRPTTFYASTKQAVENLGLNYARWCGVDFAAVRYAAVAGPWSGQGGGGPSNIFRAAVQNALRGDEAVVPAAGHEWVYSKDAAQGTVLALHARDLGTRILNIAMGRICPPEEFAAALKAAIPGARVRIDKPAAVSIAKHRPGDLTRARKFLGYEPRYDISEAIGDMIEWLRRRNTDQTRH